MLRSSIFSYHCDLASDANFFFLSLFLQEWVLLSKIAGPDKLGIHHERTIVRPKPLQGVSVCHFHVGAIVDAWWHDGWWEGIVIREESIEQLHVYFPGNIERYYCVTVLFSELTMTCI